jgi:hypothetical protein
MASKPASIIQRLIAAAVLLTILLFALQLWYVRNAGSILKSFISERSAGKIKLELSELDINLFSKRLTIDEATLSSTDSLGEPISYHVAVNRLSLNVGSVWALLFRKQLLLDSIKLYDPVIKVMQWRKDTTQLFAKDELSIPQEMGKLYNSLLTALDEFSVKRIFIHNASISLINKMKPESEPVSVSNIYFNLDRTDAAKHERNSVANRKDQSVELRTSHQAIAFPDGRHHLAFKSLHLKLFTQRIDLDSCTVTATATDSLKSNYQIFFKKLTLTGVDFAAMSRDNIIKADSVYCENPFFNINLYRSDADTKTDLPDPDKIIRDLTGNLNLAFIGVKNAGIQFDFYGKSKQSFYNSNRDNFEIRGLRINPDSSQPVSIQRFDMTFKDYHYYNEDSSSVYSFESLQFLNSKILLNNFAIRRTSGINRIRNDLYIRVPSFELSELNWYQLIFEQKLVAASAVLHQPDISFIRKREGGSGRKFNLFEGLQTVDSIVSLANVSVLKGNLNMQFGNAASLDVEDIDFNIHSNQLLRSTNKEGVRNAVQRLSFSKGVLKFKDITAELQNARFNDANLIYADRVAVSGKDNKISATVNHVYIDNMQMDDKAEAIDVDRLQWESATVLLKALPAGISASNDESSQIHLRNVIGANTQVNFSNGPLVVSTYVDALQATSIIKNGNAPIAVEGFTISGNNLFVKTNALQINAASYNVAGTDRSTVTGVQVLQQRGRDSLYITSSSVQFTTNLNDLFANNLHLADVNAEKLAVHVVKRDSVIRTIDSAVVRSPIRIDKLTATAPEISIYTFRNRTMSHLNIPWTPGSRVDASGILISDEGLRISSLLVNSKSATYRKPSGEVVGVEKGNISFDVSDIRYGKSEGKMKWSGMVNNLSLENETGLGTRNTLNKFRFTKAAMGNITLSSDYLTDFGQLLKMNVNAWLKIPEGQFIDSSKTIRWYNANYNNSRSTLTLDSFVYHPSKPLDTVLAEAPYQLDYVTFKTGAVSIDGLDVVKFQQDSALIASSMTIHQPVLTVFRDKEPPVSPFKKTKLVPVDRIKSFSIPVSLQSITLEDGTILYSEKTALSRKQGDVLFTGVTGSIDNITNMDFSENDSLAIDLRGNFLDSAMLSLHLKQSYSDTLSGFLFAGTMQPADIRLINPVLIPLANAKVLSGKLDSGYFRAVGTKESASGEMFLHYRNLRVRLVKDGNPERTTLMQHLESFIANTFIIRSHNSKRRGLMYHKRSPRHSFINYIVKITLSGVTSSIGLKKNRKIIKQAKREKV